MTSSESLDRRDFLRSGLLGTGALMLGPGLLCARRVPAADFSGADPSILVVIELAGGNDGLNTVVPCDNDAYHRARPVLGLKPQQCLRLADGLALNGQLKGLDQLYGDGSLAVVQGVGYPNPNRSHFKSMDIWHAADPSDAAKKSGWLGRFADLCCKPGADADFAVNLGNKQPLALSGVHAQPISFQNPNAYRFMGSQDEMKAFERVAGESRAARDEVLELVGKTAASARQTSDEIRAATSAYKTAVTYPTSGLAASLRTVAALIDARLSTRVFYAYHGGFDTHNNQSARQDRLLQELAQAVTAFQKDLQRSKVDGRVVTMVFSEFGRRVAENASRGTDHGTAGPMLVCGGRVKGGVYGKMPSLTDLDRGDLKFTTDFRSVYATLLEDHMRVDAARILGGKFDKLPLLG